MLRDYSKSLRYTSAELEVNYLAVRYVGPGKLDWHPDSGHEFEAYVTRTASSPTAPVGRSMKAGPMVFPTASVRMPLDNQDRATALFQAPYLMNIFDDLPNRPFWLRLSPSRVVVRQVLEPYSDRRICQASARVATKSRVLLPDSVERTLRSEGTEIELGWERKALLYRSDDVDFTLMRSPDQDIEIAWSLSDGPARRRALWHWGVHLRDALSMLASQPVAMLAQEAITSDRYWFEIRKRPEMHTAVTSGMVKSPDVLDRELYVAVARFLADGSNQAYVAHRLIGRVMAAFADRLHYSQDLAIATALEAALRTLYSATGRRYSVRNGLARFCKQYGLRGAEWDHARESAFGSFENLRHRHAHPNWMRGVEGMESRSAAESALRDRCLLVRWYGLMVLAMAGLPQGSPDLPQ